MHSCRVRCVRTRCGHRSSDKKVKLWDVRRKEAVQTFDSHTDQVRGAPVGGVACRVVAACLCLRRKGGTARLHEAVVCGFVVVMRRQVWDVAFNSDGSHFCSVGDDKVLQVFTKQ